MKQMQKGSVVVVIILFFISAGGYFFYTQNTKVATIINQNSSSEVITSSIQCSDTDGGDDYFTKGSVVFNEPVTLTEGVVLQVLSSNRIKVRTASSTKELSKGEQYQYFGPDQVYFDTTSADGSLMVSMPITLSVQEIKFEGVGDTKNSATIIRRTTTEDVCVQNVLVENSCVRGINTGYICPKGCSAGSCNK